ncbi:KRFJ protein, partial [Sitta europaea]|nr:KRFJ protein [Sitta europaea]
GCELSCPRPCASSRSLEPCVASCGHSRALIFPPPVVLTFPGPTLATCAQESVVGAAHPAELGDPIANISDESCGPGGSFGAGGSFGSGGSWGRGGSFG